MSFIQLCQSHGIKATDMGRTMTEPVVDEETGELLQDSFLARRILLEMEVPGKGTLMHRCDIDAKLMDIITEPEDDFICNELLPYIESMKMTAKEE